MDIAQLISLLVELDVSSQEDKTDYSNVFELKFSEACDKLGCNYEEISKLMDNIANLYFSECSSSEWKYVLLHLFVFKRIGELNAESSEMLSVKNNKILRKSIENFVKIAFYSKIQPKLPGYILKQYVKSDDIFYAYNIIKCSSFQLCELVDFQTLRVAVLSEGLRAILVALFQIAYCPLKKSANFSEDIYKKLLEERKLAAGFLKNLQKKIHLTLFVKETMALVQPNTPPWFKKAIFQTLNEIIVSKNGVEVISTALLDGALNDKTQTWKAIDIISKIIMSCRTKSNFEIICDQLFQLLDKLNEHNLIYEGIFVACVKEFHLEDQNLEHNIFVQKLLNDLHCFVDKAYRFQNEDLTDQVKQVLRLLNILFIEKGAENPNLPSRILVPYLDIIFMLNSITYEQGMSITNNEAKEIIKLTINSNKNYIFNIFDGLLFNIHTKTLPLRNDFLLQVINHKIFIKTCECSVTYSVSKKIEIMKRLFENETDLLFSFFEYLLNCIANTNKYFIETNKDLLASQQDIISNVFERKIAVYKILSELAKTKSIQERISKNPQEILPFFKHIFETSIKNKEHKLKDFENEKFQSLFTIIMLLHALVSLGSSIGFKEYQDIVSQLNIIEKETTHLELAELIKNILNIIEIKDQDAKVHESKEKSQLDVILEDLLDPLLPVRGQALMSLAKLVKKNNPDVLKRKHYVFTIFQQNLKHQDSFIYLSAINGLVAFTTNYTDTVLSTLCDEYSDFSRDDNEGHEVRMKLGEVLVKVTKTLGDTAPKYKALLLNTFLSGSKDDDHLVRASSLSNLGEVCRILGYKLGTVVTEILDCVHIVITTDKAVEPRRAAVTVLRQLLAGLENEMIAFLKEDILPIYRTLKQIYNNDDDEIMRLQAQLALEELNHNMQNFLFPKPEITMGSKLLRLA